MNKSKSKKKYETCSPEYWNDILHIEFARESDRAAVILAAALFDSALDSLLRTYLVSSPTSSDEIFDSPNAPLSTFNSKINIAYRLSLISQSFCRDLHIIRKIRNDFSHNIHSCSFEQSSVKSRILELEKSSNIIKKHPRKRAQYPRGGRGDFLLISSWMLFSLYQRIQEIVPVKPIELEWGYDPKLKESYHKKRKKKRSKKSK